MSCWKITIERGYRSALLRVLWLGNENQSKSPAVLLHTCERSTWDTSEESHIGGTLAVRHAPCELKCADQQRRRQPTTSSNFHLSSCCIINCRLHSASSTLASPTYSLLLLPSHVCKHLSIITTFLLLLLFFAVPSSSYSDRLCPRLQACKAQHVLLQSCSSAFRVAWGNSASL